MRDREHDELLRLAGALVELFVPLNRTRVVVACADQEKRPRRDAIDHVYRFVFECLLDRLERDIAFHRRILNQERLEEGLGLGRVQDGYRIERPALAFADALLAVGREILLQLDAGGIAARVEYQALAVAEAHLCHHGLNARIDRCGVRRMPPAEAGAPQSDAIRVDLRHPFHIGDSVADVVDLLEREQAPPRAFAAAEAAVVECERDEARLAEGLGVVGQDAGADPREPVAEHDAGSPLAGFHPVRQEEIAFQLHAFAVERYRADVHV